MRRALVFGGSGQAGSYLVELLAAKGYQVYAPDRERVNFESYLFQDQLCGSMRTFMPDEVYNFASLMFAPDSWKEPNRYMQVCGSAVLSILDAMFRICPKARFFQAGSADIFYPGALVKHSEVSPKFPSNPYGAAKLFAYHIVEVYRMQGLQACTGIFFNMESPRRKKTFFAQKVAAEVVRLKKEFDEGGYTPIYLERLDAIRDWGWAPEYVEAAWIMMQQPELRDYVIATGYSHTCREFVTEALKVAGLPHTERDFSKYVEFDRKSHPDATVMRANPKLASLQLNWQAKSKMRDVVRMLVEAEMKKEVECVSE